MRDDEILAVADEAGARQNDPVVTISAGQPAGGRIDDRRFRPIIETWIEVRDVVRRRVPRLPERPAEAAFQGQLLGRLPRILKEDVRGERSPFCESPLAELGVVAHQAERGVRDCQARAARTGVEKFKSAVLVVRAAGNRVDVDLVEVVLARVLDRDPRLQRVTPLDQRRRIGEQIDRPRR